MPIKIDDNHSNKFQCIVDDNNHISAEKMKNVLKTSADKALWSLNNKVLLNNGVIVDVTRRDKLPYTLKMRAQSGKYQSSVDVDLVPALKLSSNKLPEKIQHRIQGIQKSSCSKTVDECLAIAMPIVHKDKLEVDFPQLGRQMLVGRPSAKMAIRLLKQERNEKGGPMEKIWSHSIKMAVLHEVSKNPNPEHWHEAKLPDRYMDIRNSMQGYLKQSKMIDIFYPEINMMDRIKNTNVKTQIATYLERTGKQFKQAGKIFICATSQCNRHFSTQEGSKQHEVDKHQHKREHGGNKNPRIMPCTLEKCGKLFRDKYGSVQHSVMAHKEEAKEKDVWRIFLRDQGKIPCSFCNCAGGFVRGFSSMEGYNAHASAMNH